MNRLEEYSKKVFGVFLSEKSKEKGEEFILFIAISSFMIHLGIILIANLSFFPTLIQKYPNLSNPISVIYTPFSFVLIYEFYLLIYYLPKSFTTYIGKQYEIVTLIIIRRLFKDLSNLEISSDWFSLKNDLQFTYDILSTILLFFLIYVFYELAKRNYRDLRKNQEKVSQSVVNFINFKKVIAIFLVPLLILMFSYNSIHWILQSISMSNAISTEVKNFNNIFFYDFFTVLILVDVLLLLFSFLHTDKFHKVIRNSGFIISTILLRFSFTTEGLVSSALTILAVTFGILLLFIHNLYDRSEINYPRAD
jgi:hypothetical protein